MPRRRLALGLLLPPLLPPGAALATHVFPASSAATGTWTASVDRS